MITIRLVSPSPLNVIVSGEVTNPGSFTIDLVGGVGNTPGVQYPTLTQALKQANGVTLSADIRNIEIRRTIWDKNGKEEKILIVDLQDLTESKQAVANLTLRDEDQIFVPTNSDVNLKELWQLARVDFAINVNTGRTIAVVGEVRNPGSYYIHLAIPGTSTIGLPTVSLAIQEAGGIKPLADLRNIQIRRQTKNGSEQFIDIDLWKLLHNGDITQDTVLQDGDTIIIPTAQNTSNSDFTELSSVSFAPKTIQVTVVGEVQSPGVTAVPPNTSLNQVLLNAGGFNGSRAKTNQVQLLRLNSDGTLVSRYIGIDMNAGINEQTNPLLQNNDIIFVNRSGIARFSDPLNEVLSPATRLVSVFDIPLRALDILRRLGVQFDN
jgi:polysaccharide export outer membrane protein